MGPWTSGSGCPGSLSNLTHTSECWSRAVSLFLCPRQLKYSIGCSIESCFGPSLAMPLNTCLKSAGLMDILEVKLRLQRLCWMRVDHGTRDLDPTSHVLNECSIMAESLIATRQRHFEACFFHSHWEHLSCLPVCCRLSSSLWAWQSTWRSQPETPGGRSRCRSSPSRDLVTSLMAENFLQF